MMRAALIRQYGAPANICTEEVPKPVPSKKFPLLVKVMATTVNPADCKQRSGNLKMVVKHEFPVSFGQDFAGVIEAAPEGCRYKPGDHVYGCTAPRNGCGAEFVCVSESECAPKPSALDWAEAAATATSVATAYRGIVSIGGATAGQSVLVHGAAGGVGAAACQIAMASGCKVWGTCSTGNRAFLTSLGITPLDYASLPSELAAAGVGGSCFDLVLDAVGGDDYYELSLPLLVPNGKYLSAVGPVRNGGSEPITVGTLLWTMRKLIPRLLVAAIWPWRKYHLYLSFDVGDLRQPELAKWIEARTVLPRLDPQPFDLSQLADAHTKCETHHSEGRIVIQVGDGKH